MLAKAIRDREKLGAHRVTGHWCLVLLPFFDEQFAMIEQYW